MPWYKRPLTEWMLFGGGLVVAAVGCGLVAHAIDLDGEATMASTPAAANALESDSLHYKIGGGIVAGIGGAAVITGIVFLMLPNKAKPKNLAFAIAPARGGGVAALELRF